MASRYCFELCWALHSLTFCELWATIWHQRSLSPWWLAASIYSHSCLSLSSLSRQLLFRCCAALLERYASCRGARNLFCRKSSHFWRRGRRWHSIFGPSLFRSLRALFASCALSNSCDGPNCQWLLWCWRSEDGICVAGASRSWAKKINLSLYCWCFDWIPPG